GVALQDSTNVSGVRRAVLVDDVAENEHFARAEDIRRRPIKRGPIHGEPEIAFALRRESANRGAVEGQVVPALNEKLLIIVEHVEAAFEVAKEHGYGLNALFVSQILEAFLLDFMDRCAIFALLLGVQIQLLQLIVRESEKIPQ